LVERPLKELCRRSPSGGGTQRRVKVVQWPAIEPITSKERYMKYAIAAAAIAAVFAAGSCIRSNDVLFRGKHDKDKHRHDDDAG
jgi:hypothetical protein